MADDSEEAIAATAEALDGRAATAIESLNGFCLAARTERWLSGAYRPETVFDPRHKMLFQEYSLQRKWRSKGRRCGLAESAFVFHYRSVTRGEKFAMGQRYRMLS